jgi:hypothetical protein
MDAGSMLIAGLAGALVLGDRVVDGRLAWAVAGSLLVLASVVALSRCTSPPSPTPPVDRNVRDGETRDVTRA